MNEEQRTPDELNPKQQAELICKKLLGLQVLHLPYSGTKTCTTWCDEKYKRFDFIDQFETWAEAGLILDALSSRSVDPTLEYSDGKWDCYGGDPFESFIHAYRDTGPLAIRAAALEYIRSLP